MNRMQGQRTAIARLHRRRRRLHCADRVSGLKEGNSRNLHETGPEGFPEFAQNKAQFAHHDRHEQILPKKSAEFILEEFQESEDSRRRFSVTLTRGRLANAICTHNQAAGEATMATNIRKMIMHEAGVMLAGSSIKPEIKVGLCNASSY